MNAQPNLNLEDSNPEDNNDNGETNVESTDEKRGRSKGRSRGPRGPRSERRLHDMSDYRRRGERPDRSERPDRAEFADSDRRERHPRGRRRRQSRGDLRAAVLGLVALEPRHGYELMQEISDRTNGSWHPSPGSIYPTLQHLQDEGLVRIEHDDSNRGVAHLTEAGVAYIAEQAIDLDALFEQSADRTSDSQKQLWEAGSDLMRAAKQVNAVGTPEQVGEAVKLLQRTQRSLYAILAQEPTDS